MDIIIAQAVGFTSVDGKKLLHARKLDETHKKHQMIMSLFSNLHIQFFFNIGNSLNHFLKRDIPLVFVTDWSDPTEMVGLLLEEDNKKIAYPDLGFLAFYTNWDDLKNSGIEDIFSHEFSHLWLYFLGFDFSLSKANKFHTITSVTDQYMAFSEGFAEHLEIVSDDFKKGPITNTIYDHGLDIESWLSYRDSSLRRYAVKNNRFIYHTAHPYFEDFSDYNELHLAHITSSAFTPERIKNASQMMASEGVVSSFFYHFYMDEFFKEQYCEDSFYCDFNIAKNDVDSLTNHYLKILYILSKINLKSETILIDFIIKYCEIYKEESKRLLKLFLDITNYTTVDVDYRMMFEVLYTTGKLGDPSKFKKQLLKVREEKDRILKDVLCKPQVLKKGLYPILWVEGDAFISPVPWDEAKVKYKFDLNTASCIDLMSFKDLQLEDAEMLIKKRETQKGFVSIADFKNSY